MNEPLWVPEDQLKYVIDVIEAGCDHTDIPRGTKKNLRNWCEDMKKYLKRLEEE